MLTNIVLVLIALFLTASLVASCVAIWMGWRAGFSRSKTRKGRLRVRSMRAEIEGLRKEDCA